MSDDRIDRARHHYERAVFNGDSAVLDLAERELDQVDADLSLARGRILHARLLAERRFRWFGTGPFWFLRRMESGACPI